MYRPGLPPEVAIARSVSPCRQRLPSTLRPFHDFRGLFLLALCAIIGLVTDPAAILSLAGYLAYVIGMAGAALMLAKVVMPYLDASEHAASALNDGNVAGALVVLARSLFIVGFLACIMAGGK